MTADATVLIIVNGGVGSIANLGAGKKDFGVEGKDIVLPVGDASLGNGEGLIDFLIVTFSMQAFL